MEEKKTIITLLCIAIGGLVAAIVWLALYIKGLHSKNEANTERFTKVTADVNSSITAVTKSLESNTKILDDLHKFILTAIRIKP